jgi:hypothetical protein
VYFAEAGEEEIFEQFAADAASADEKDTGLEDITKTRISIFAVVSRPSSARPRRATLTWRIVAERVPRLCLRYLSREAMATAGQRSKQER